MPTKHFKLTDFFVDSATEYTGEEITRLHRIVDTQVVGTLQVLGAGVVSLDEDGPNPNSLLVTADGSSVLVGRGMGILEHPELGLVFIYLPTETTPEGLTANGVQNIFVVIEEAADVGDNDTQETAIPRVIASAQTSLTGGLRLGQLTMAGGVLVEGSYQDLRAFTRLDALINTVAALAERVTEAEERLEALEGGDETSTGGIQYGTQLKWSAEDPRTLTTVIEEKIAAALATALDSIEAGGEQESIAETDQMWQILLQVRRELARLAPHVANRIVGAGAVPGLYGTASAGDSTEIDRGGTLPEVPQQRVYDSR